MDTTSLTSLADELLADARQAHAQRAARTVYGGQEHALRQTMIALASGAGLSEHESPGEATLHVLDGNVRFVAGEDTVELGAGDHLVIPGVRHSLEATSDAVVLLTVSNRR